MKSILTPLLLCFMMLSAAVAEHANASVAKIDYNEIDDLLVQVVLSRDGNEGLGERFVAKKEAAKAAQEKMQAAMMRGEPVNPMEAAAGMLHADPDKKKVEQLCQKHLLEVIDRVFGGKYEIIFKDGYRSSLIYSKAAIDDVTVVIKQELLRSLPSN